MPNVKNTIYGGYFVKITQYMVFFALTRLQEYGILNLMVYALQGCNESLKDGKEKQLCSMLLKEMERFQVLIL